MGTQVEEMLWALTCLFNALVATNATLRVQIVTCNAVATGHAAETAPYGAAQACVAPFAQCAAAENAHLSVLSVDVDSLEGPGLRASLAHERLLPVHEDAVVWREGSRYTPRLKSDTATPKHPHSWTEPGVYVLAGGLGALGRQIARHMALKGARRLALVGRTRAPDRAEWPRLAQDPASAAAVGDLLRVEEAGARLSTHVADVADAAAMRRVLAELEGEGPILGILHLAACPKESICAVQHLDPQRLSRCLAAKVRGTVVLDALVRERQVRPL